MLCSFIILTMATSSYFHSLAMHDESTSRRKVDDDVHEGAVPAYLLDREDTTRAKVCLFEFGYFKVIDIHLQLVIC